MLHGVKPLRYRQSLTPESTSYYPGQPGLRRLRRALRGSGTPPEMLRGTMGGLQAAFLLCWALICASRQNPRVRLAGGPNPCSGFLQVMHADQWGNVCDDRWTKINAAVVCRELRCGGVSKTDPDIESFTRPEGKFVLDEVNCTGKEKSLLDCNSDSLGLHNCVIQEEVAVICTETIKLRLSGGQSRCAGRVEVYWKGSWGGVCDNIWDKKNAEVVCRELNCGYQERIPERLHFGRRMDPVWMSSLQCSKNEVYLWQCAQDSTPKCSSKNGAQVVCTGHMEWRLSGTERACRGQLLVKEQTDFIQVCPDHWTPEAGQVACRQLGCGRLLSPANVTSTSHTWKALKAGAKHVGNESTLWQDFLPALANCSREEALHIDCLGNVTVRLSDGCAGIVEVFYEDAWRKVCHRGAGEWRRANAQVVCQETKCGKFGFFGQKDLGRSSSQEFVMSDVDCLGGEQFLWQCGFSRYTDDCQGKEVHMTCSKGVSVRLVDGGSRCAGRVEVHYLGKWGTVCGDGWPEESSNIVCQQLDCGDFPKSESIFGEGAGPIWFTKVECTDSDKFLWECSKSFETQGCTHSKDIGVVCQKHVDLQLIGGSCSGQLEVSTFTGIRQGVKNTTGWDDNTANVACHQLHCGRSVGTYFEEAKTKKQQSFHCHGNETALTDCSIIKEPKKPNGSGSGTGDDYYDNEQDVEEDSLLVLAVNCSETPVLRLAGGGQHCAGRVEIYYQGQWGTVCDTNWNERAATLVCKELGCGSELDHRFKGVGGANAPPAWLDLQECTENTEFLWHCSYKPRKLHTCQKGSPAEVICSGSLEYRLVNGRSPCAGMVEVLFRYRWWKVCSSEWLQNYGGFICNTLNCGSKVAKYPGEKAGSDSKWLKDVTCKGQNNTECTVEAITETDCSRGMAAAMTCSGHQELYLKGDRNPCSGQVQVHYIQGNDAKWKAISEKGWDQKAADVACKQLNCGNAIAFNSTTFEMPDRWNQMFHCTGNESSLWDCNKTVSTNEATRAATVTCSESIEVRLKDHHRCSGLIELKYKGKWGKVCSQHWDNNNGFGDKMCKALNCTTFIGAMNEKVTDAEITWATYLHCGANSLHPWQCLTTRPEDSTCPSGQAIAIVCSDSLAFRLRGGYSRCDGRVEIRYNGEWGTVCNRKLDNRTANLICQSLKCGWSRLLFHSSITRHGNLPVVLTDMSCSERDEKLQHCEGTWGKTICPRTRPVSLVCSDGIDPETMKTDVATVVTAVLVPLLLVLVVALGIVLRRWRMSSKKRGDANPVNQMDSQKNMEGAADSDIEDERYDDAELVIPLSRLPGII
ncbi:hypothetical protein NDU88_000780 [Pleurodeles waltl]|uniref:SRCR domain-containing protein n=1 Tax=Pleurodeles waltl TaxID=8319 RepID=A0AAV7LWI1_PLEWA|nr:hypothetical protein NDU88_000780 [Pleurodeles waltl]